MVIKAPSHGHLGRGPGMLARFRSRKKVHVGLDEDLNVLCTGVLVPAAPQTLP